MGSEGGNLRLDLKLIEVDWSLEGDEGEEGGEEGRGGDHRSSVLFLAPGAFLICHRLKAHKHTNTQQEQKTSIDLLTNIHV